MAPGDNIAVLSDIVVPIVDVHRHMDRDFRLPLPIWHAA